MTFTARTALVAPIAVALLVSALSACSGSTDNSVSGLRDDLRFVPKKTVRDTRPRMVEQCTTGTKRVRHTSTSQGKTRTWYTTEPTRSCTTVQKGKESYDRVTRQPRWCVELDNVDGNANKDDVWFEVDASTYSTAADTREGRQLSFTPLRAGC
ncbi:hypothetical protein ACFVV7_34020 [Streptomyces globisporus]|uniref:hypothetical protein n=1 Tax=Streptomyces globisporus TaxID=1908 RepID=UPI0036DC575E